jgi:antirestriction protein ArdC
LSDDGWLVAIAQEIGIGCEHQAQGEAHQLGDPRMILKAASAAQRAADYVRGKLPIGEPAAAEDGRQKEAEVSVVAV